MVDNVLRLKAVTEEAVGDGGMLLMVLFIVGHSAVSGKHSITTEGQST